MVEKRIPACESVVTAPSHVRNLRSRECLDMKTTILSIATVLILTGIATAQYPHKTLIAHRGASAYAPEHSMEAYKLAIAQHADYVEQDLQVSKDGVLVCLHDLTLERTTNVKDVFPDRFVAEKEQGRDVKHWYVADFTLAEIK